MSYVIHGCAGSDSWSIYQGGIHIFTGSKQACLDYLDLLAFFLMTISRPTTSSTSITKVRPSPVCLMPSMSVKP